MNIVHGDLWDYVEEGWIVVTTNIGWNKFGENIMGAGIAAQAKSRFPDLPAWYGQVCRTMQADTPVVHWPEGRLILFPTKSLLPETPWRSWAQDSDPELIKRSLEQLKWLIPQLPRPRKVFMPPPGCGNGNLPLRDTISILQNHLSNENRVTLVLR